MKGPVFTHKPPQHSDSTNKDVIEISLDKMLELVERVCPDIKKHVQQKPAKKTTIIREVLSELASQTQESMERSAIVLSNKTSEFMRTLYMLNYFKNNTLYDRIIKRLILDNFYHSKSFELYVASMYHSMGHKIVPLKSGSVSRCDFEVTTKSGKSLFVECKSIKNIEHDINNKYGDIINCLYNVLEGCSQSVSVYIVPSKDLFAINEKELSNAVKQWIDNDIFGSMVRQDSTIQIKRHSINPDMARMVKHENGIVINSGVSIYSSSMRVDRQIVVNVQWNFDHDVSERIIKHIGKARKQIPDGESGVLHVEASTNIKLKLFDIHSKGLIDIVTRLNVDTTKINAICLHGRFVKSPFSVGYSNYNVVIPNFSAQRPLPEDVDLVGSNDIGAPEHEPQGTVVAKYDSKFREQITGKSPCIIFNSVHKHGLSQVMLVKSSDDHVYAHICSPQFGFKIVVAKIDFDSIVGFVKIAVRWDKDLDILVFCNDNDEPGGKRIDVEPLAQFKFPYRRSN